VIVARKKKKKWLYRPPQSQDNCLKISGLIGNHVQCYRSKKKYERKKGILSDEVAVSLHYHAIDPGLEALAGPDYSVLVEAALHLVDQGVGIVRRTLFNILLSDAPHKIV
jgi:hypothetical protein